VDVRDDIDLIDGDEAEINITPLVDVCLVLVLIFMVTAPFMAKALMPVALPQAVTAQTEATSNITVSISPNEGYAINEIPLDKRALQAELKKLLAKSDSRFILIRADERVPHGDIEDLLKLGKRLGASRIAFATVPKGLE
jgi:biopolymer transport protein ExbD